MGETAKDVRLHVTLDNGEHLFLPGEAVTLDADKADALIREGFKSYIPETTKIIIAQRVASVQDADLILVMDGGAIAASGTHEELLKTSGIYREVYESQTNGGDENA